MDFDSILDQRAAFNHKWVALPKDAGADGETGIAMSVADSDFRTAPVVLDAVGAMVEHGCFPYGADWDGYTRAVAEWQGHRHSWDVDPDWIVSTQGLGHGIAMCINTWSEPGDGVCYFTPVYHEFRLKTLRTERRPVELPLRLENGRYELDLDAAAAALDPGVKILLFCAPQNPSGRVWSAGEMRAVAEFAEAHDLILVSDEVHADLIYPGATHIPMDIAAPAQRDRTLTATAASKSFNLAGLRAGQMIIPDETLRTAYQRSLRMSDYGPGTVGAVATMAAYTPEGETWLKAQIAYLDDNRAVFDAGINAIPGLHSMRLESTFLAWVDFSGTGMTPEEIATRIRDDAKIAVGAGPEFGKGGELWSRFNFAMPRVRIEDAVARMQAAFGDLQ
ncbi:MAG: aminotransferase class I/II-fold pyridoxal phosphate-dependent enzyme [Roseicyclus sp.]|nr:aminotransferase class I/II-fold pyridoxal phosphate-dependent enzyme [Roseicyclus sp.]